MMRYFLYTIWIMMASCGGADRADTRAFIPGLYVRSIHHEFATGSDTLLVRQLQGDTYQIIKRSAFSRIRGGTALPTQYDTTVWTGIYHAKDQVIYEQQKGKVISFQPKENKLLVGASAYRKIKQ